MNFEQLLQIIMDSDVNIRHSVITDVEGNITTVNHRLGVVITYLKKKLQLRLKEQLVHGKQESNSVKK